MFELGCNFNRAEALSEAKRELVLMLVAANALQMSKPADKVPKEASLAELINSA